LITSGSRHVLTAQILADPAGASAAGGLIVHKTPPTIPPSVARQRQGPA
jgi:hypothetical protein